jgi:hypothetical protein
MRGVRQDHELAIPDRQGKCSRSARRQTWSSTRRKFSTLCSVEHESQVR